MDSESNLAEDRFPFRPRPPGERAIEKREGITETERDLGALADRTFLSLWSYPGVYRAQKVDVAGNGKELCDLLVVFEDHVLIFSDKEVRFQEDKPIKIAWSRWYRKAIRKSADQIFGAERWLKEYPGRVYLDSACTVPFPVEIPPPDRMKVHRVVVARGSKAAVQDFFGGSLGSLMLQSNLMSDEHLEADPPFTIGQVAPERGFVHVLDDVTLGILLNTFDTVQDFVDYLSRKERLFNSDVRVFAAGEEDLVGMYMHDVGEDGKNDFVFPAEASFLYIPEGTWQEFSTHPQRLAQLQADQVSYAWDTLIERFAVHVLGDTQYNTTNFENPMEAETILRFLAREPRTRRRMLSRGFLQLVEAVEPEAAWKARVYVPSSPGDPLYVFMAHRRPAKLSFKEYRSARNQVLTEYMRCAKVVYPDALDIVGIAVGLPGEDDNSEDLAYLDCHAWAEIDQRQAELLQEETGFLKEIVHTEAVEKTYPDLPVSRSPSLTLERGQQRRQRMLKGSQRNQPCPCGSRRKYKHCCGKRS